MKNSEKCSWKECTAAVEGKVLGFENRTAVLEMDLCGPHIDEAVLRYRSSKQGLGKAIQLPGMCSCEVEMLVGRFGRRTSHVVLKECGGLRHFVLELTECDTMWLAWNIRQLPFPYLTTHKSFAEVINQLGATLRDVRIHEHDSDQHPDFFRAQLNLERNGRLLMHVVRPSDALSLAHVCGVPILVAEEFLKA